VSVLTPPRSASRESAGGAREETAMSALLVFLIVLLALALAGGGWDFSRYGVVACTLADPATSASDTIRQASCFREARRRRRASWQSQVGCPSVRMR
jgi:hypothetical protein